MKKNIKIDGMTCAACAARIERFVGKVDGVNSANVNFAAETLAVDYEKTDMKAIEAAIVKAGYKIADEKTKKKLPHSKVMMIRLILSAIFTLPLLYISMGHMLGAPLPEAINPHFNPLGFALSQAVLTIPTMLIAWKFYSDGFKNLFRLSPNMDSLIAVSTSAAFIYGIYSTVMICRTADNEYAMHLYFESVAVILTLITLGKFLEAISKSKTEGSVKRLMSLAPKTAFVVRNGKELEVKLETIAVGDTVVCKAGESFAADGTVTKGTALVDESMLTGESIPIEKNVGDKVTGAYVNKSGYVLFTAEKVGADTALSRIIRFVEDAQGSKAPVARLADKAAAVFVPTVLALAVIAAVGWLIAGEGVEFSLKVFVSVLVIACPCALGLATPVAIMVGTGAAAERGILIKGGEPLEKLCRVTAVMLDKTGTLTSGKPTVTDIASLSGDENRLLSYCAAAEAASEHPLSEAIVSCAKERGVELSERAEFKTFAGKGISAIIVPHNTVLIGNEQFMTDNSVEIPSEFSAKAASLADKGKTPVYAAENGVFSGIIAVSDVIRADSAQAVKRLKEMKIRTEMLTGDNEKTASAVCAELGLDGFSAGILPEGKAARIKSLQTDGQIVAMAGDGINDAVALSQADVGISVGQGTDVAIDCADVVLVRNSLLDLCAAIKISEAAMRGIKQNLFWAFGYNILGIPIAMGLLHIFGGPLLNPMIAAAAMSLSSVSVIGNALRLRPIIKKIKR